MQQQATKDQTAKRKQLQSQKQKQSKMVAEPNVCILTYYYIRGLCQPIRNLLYYLDIQFVDRRLDRYSIETLQLDKLESTFNSGLPSFKDGDLTFCDCVGISMYICHKYNGKSLIGNNIKTKAKINEVLFKYWMQKKKIIPEIAQIIRKTTGYHEADKGIMIREMINRLISEVRFVNFCLSNHQKSEGWVLGDLTLIDFYFYETCFYICGFFQSYIKNDDKLKSFNDFCHKFEELDFHRKHDARKTKLFLPFKSENLREVILSAWQGDEQQELD